MISPCKMKRQLYTWIDNNNKHWYFYYSEALYGWVYKRENHSISSTKFKTLKDAVADLEKAFS